MLVLNGSIRNVFHSDEVLAENKSNTVTSLVTWLLRHCDHNENQQADFNPSHAKPGFTILFV